MNSESTVVPQSIPAELSWLRKSPQPTRARAHSCQCMCPTCESAGAGFFAQLAALAGQPTAAEHLGDAVYSFLRAEAKNEEKIGT